MRGRPTRPLKDCGSWTLQAARAGNSSSDTAAAARPSVNGFRTDAQHLRAERNAWRSRQLTRTNASCSLPTPGAKPALRCPTWPLVAKFVELLTDCASYPGRQLHRAAWSQHAARCQPWSAAYRLNLPINAASSHKIVQSVFQFPNNRYEVFAEARSACRKQPQHHSNRVAGIHISPTADFSFTARIVFEQSVLAVLWQSGMPLALITWVYTESAAAGSSHSLRDPLQSGTGLRCVHSGERRSKQLQLLNSMA
uniref:Uncharacterized protein n=1 Tax=Macrostomum lignano TaxID=282301 RepID=A0A1I8FRD2_9PLAT